MVIFGTRPEAIKVAPIITELADDARFDVIPVVTGQHREMLDQVNSVFGVVPVRDLDLLSHGMGLNGLASAILGGLDPVLEEYSPDAVVVQGDTTTVMAAAIAAFYQGIPVVHVEAGLRSHDIHSPFPEEANRRIVSQVTSLHLAPTAKSRENLLREDIDAATIAVTGNTVIDALLKTVDQKYDVTNPEVSAAIDSGRRILLVTTHRRENWGGAMEGVGRALRTISDQFPDDLIVLPAHKNPIVREAILPSLEGAENVISCEPLPYPEFTAVLAASHIVLTDSGGVQEEAPALGKPVLVMRENTERPEAVDAGTVRLIGTDEERIVSEVTRLKSSESEYLSMARATNPYGDGRASERCVAAIAQLLGVGTRVSDFSVGSQKAT